MTVCVAAIFGATGVLGACDRMLTAGDIQFEPEIPKIRMMSSSAAIMIAGDANFQTEIITATLAEVTSRIRANPNEWLPIREVAQIYGDKCDEASGRLAERRILKPLGLTRLEFIGHQRTMSPEVVANLTQELINYSAPAIEAIVSGVDNDGPHIYVVTNRSLECFDSVGFAAIGSGSNHSNSQMMAFNHTFHHDFGDTLMNVLFAKKRAEIAPGVGKSTDMYFVPGLGQLDMVKVSLVEELEKRYENERIRQQELANTSRQEVNDFVRSVLEGSTPRDQGELPTPSDPDNSGEEPTISVDL